MANEITLQCSLSRKDPANTTDFHDFPSFRKLIDQTLKRHYDSVHPVTTTESNVTFSTITTNGWCLLVNLSTTATVDWGVATGVYTGMLNPGEIALFRLKASKSLYFDGSANADVRVIVYGA